MIGVAWVQAILDGLGSILAALFSLVSNYGIAIVLLTLGIRVLLLPLGIKQVRSMQGMQAIQPKVKVLQQKHKGNRQKMNEEVMKLYKEHGVNPFSGCLPLLAQFPVLIALFVVIQFPSTLTHVPRDSNLFGAIVSQDTEFAGMNLLCNALQAGSTVDVGRGNIPETVRDVAPEQLDCGGGIPVRIPHYLLAVAMIGTTYYQQRQMQRASPPGAQQQQAILRIMPLLFGFWGFFFPAGLVLYWTTTNLVQIGQQHFLLGQRRRHESVPTTGGDGSGDGKAPAAGKQLGAGPKATERPSRPQESKGSRGRQATRPAKGQATGGGAAADGAGAGNGADTGKAPRPKSGAPGGQQGRGPSSRGSGGRSAGSRKKRRKR